MLSIGSLLENFLFGLLAYFDCLFRTYTYSASSILGCVDVIGPTVGPRERPKSGFEFVYFEWITRVLILKGMNSFSCSQNCFGNQLKSQMYASKQTQ